MLPSARAHTTHFSKCIFFALTFSPAVFFAGRRCKNWLFFFSLLPFIAKWHGASCIAVFENYFFYLLPYARFLFAWWFLLLKRTYSVQRFSGCFVVVRCRCRSHHQRSLHTKYLFCDRCWASLAEGIAVLLFPSLAHFKYKYIKMAIALTHRSKHEYCALYISISLCNWWWCLSASFACECQSFFCLAK